MCSKVLIIADDLTGALDTAVGFAGACYKVVVARNIEGIEAALALSPDILAINTASRELPAEAAQYRVARALSQLDRGAFETVYKKVDSRLKGNIAAETQVQAAWCGAKKLIACPAIPNMGRFVEAGDLVGAGVASPLKVAEYFTGYVEVPEVGADADLDALICGADAGTMWIGARSLAFALARAKGVSSPRKGTLTAPIMFANGSRDPITKVQVDMLHQRLNIIMAPNGVASKLDEESLPLAVSISDGKMEISEKMAARQFAKTVVQQCNKLKPSSLVICGGESAQEILDQFGIGCLQVLAELMPGLPLCEINTDWGKIRLITKSGGFGAPNLLLDVYQESQGTVATAN